jgi:DNA-binding LacI/PurR family transcriptional regulator
MKPRPTRADVAAQAGVSKTTVTYVLSDRSDVTIPEGTRERVRIAASALGYRPHAAAKALASGRTNAITVAFPMRIGAHGARVLQAFERQANAHRCQLIASTIGNVQLENILPDLSDLLEGLTDGLILVDMPVAFQPYLDQAVPSSKPIVSMGVFTVPNMDSVQVEISQGIADAFEHLLQGGARRLAFLGPGGIFSDGAMAVFERDPRPLIYQQTMVQANRPAEFIPADPASRLAAVQSLTEHIERSERSVIGYRRMYAWWDATAARKANMRIRPYLRSRSQLRPSANSPGSSCRAASHPRPSHSSM